MSEPYHVGDILLIEDQTTGERVEVRVVTVYDEGWYQVMATTTGKTSLILQLGTERPTSEPERDPAAIDAAIAARKAFDTAVQAAEDLAAFGLTAEQIGPLSTNYESVEALYERLRQRRERQQ